LAKLIAEDGSLINPFGQRADGFIALATMDSDYSSDRRGMSINSLGCGVEPIRGSS